MPDIPKQEAKLVAVDGKQTDYHDTGKYRVPGLVLRVSPSGRRSWVVTARRPGHRNSSRFTIGDHRDMTLTEARDAALAFKAKLRNGGDPVAEKRKRRAEAAAKATTDPDTVRSASVRFLEHCRKKNRTANEQERVMTLDVLPHWGDRQLSDIRRRDVLALLDRKAKTSPTMANRLLALVRRFFNWAIEVDLLDANPASGVKPPQKEQSRDRVLSDEELKAVWNAADGQGWPFGPITQLLILTAQRRDEIVSMRRSEIDANEKMWTIPGARAKNGREHRVPLSDMALATIEQLPVINGSDFVFPSSRNPKDKPVSGLSKAKQKIDAASDVYEWRFHDLRRTVASGMARHGIAPHVVEKILNHVSGTLSGVAGVFNRFGYDDEKRHALDAWAAHMESVVNGRKGDNITRMATTT